MGYPSATHPIAREHVQRWDPDFIPPTNNHYDRKPAEVCEVYPFSLRQALSRVLTKGLDRSFGKHA